LAELHRMSSRCGAGDPGFTPEPVSFLHQHSIYHAIRGRVRRALAAPERLESLLPPASRPLVAAAVAAVPGLLENLRGLIAARMSGMRLRLHGDPRLERILFTGQ